MANILSSRAVLDVTSTDAASFLERLVTCRTDDMNLGDARYGALLTPQGKIIADFLILAIEDGFRLDVAAEALDDLAKRLRLFKLRADVAIVPRPDLAVVLDESGFEDPRSRDLPKRTFASADAAFDPGDTIWRAKRLAAGVSEFGEDFGSADVFPADINMDALNGVDFKKGCFVGQEVVSRMKRRGTARRRTLVARGAAVETGAEIISGDASIGAITSAVDGIGLTRVRIDRLAAGGAPSIAGASVDLTIPDWLAPDMADVGADG